MGLASPFTFSPQASIPPFCASAYSLLWPLMGLLKQGALNATCQRGSPGPECWPFSVHLWGHFLAASRKRNVADLVKMAYPLCFLLEFVDVTLPALQGKSTVSVDSASEIYCKHVLPCPPHCPEAPWGQEPCLSFLLYIPSVLSTRVAHSRCLGGICLMEKWIPSAFVFIQSFEVPLSFTRAL